MRILITGASGLIGSALCEKLSLENHEITCISRNAYENTKKYEWIKHDLVNDSWGLLPKLEIDVVIHLAAQTSVKHARQKPIEDAMVNVIGSLNLFEYLRALKRKPFVVMSGTATQIGITDKISICEDIPEKPITFYDIGKHATEQYLKQYIREGLLRGCALRLANVYGGLSGGQKSDRGILDKVINQAKRGEEIIIYGDGAFIRDYIYIDDVVTAFISAIENQEKTNGKFYYIGTGKGTSLKSAFEEVVKSFANVNEINSRIEHVVMPDDISEIDLRNAIVDSSLFKKDTGWSPKFDLDNGLREVLIRKNRHNEN